MRKQFFILTLICFVHLSWAQKYDYVWVRGTGSQTPPPDLFKTSFMDFKTNPPTVTLGKKYPPLLGAIGSMSDSTGKLLFFTNLIQVFNANEDIMINGDTINYGKVWEDFKDHGYPSVAGTKIVPIYNDSLFLMIYVQLHTDSKYLIGSPARYAIIDPYYQNNLGRVVQKDKPYHIGNTLNYDLVKHGNGKDWWIILCEWNVNDNAQKYYRFLVNQKGEIDSIGKQNFPIPTGIGGATRISQNGKLYVRYCSGDSLNSFSVFDLDRCTGMLHFSHSYKFTQVENIYGFEISPNGRYIYPSKPGSEYQINLENLDSYLFIDSLANYDGYSEGQIGSCFGFSQLTPNNEIMVLPRVCNPKAINIIHKPDLPGQSADFEQHAIIGPNFASRGPQFPNYRLKELSGSPCDTIGFVNINTDWLTDTTSKQLCLLPTIPKSFTKLALRIYDQTGDNILEDQFTSPQTSYCLKTDNLLPGKYVWYMWIDDKKVLKDSIQIP
jgi:hypothetical protein